MNKRSGLLVLIITMGMMVSTGPVRAEEAISSSPITGAKRPGMAATASSMSAMMKAKVEQHRQDIKTRLEGMKTKIASRQAERKAKLEEKIKDHVIDMFARMMKRLRAAVERLGNIMDRIDSRLVKLASKGVKTEKLEADLQKARDALQGATSLLDAVEVEFPTTVAESDMPREGLAVMRETMQEFKDKVKEIHRLLTNVVSQMRVAKGLTGTEAPEATSEAE